MVVRAISIRQPWAWLIIHGGKDIENRGWPASYRGPVLVHASGTMTGVDYEECRCFAAGLGVAVPAAAELERGGIVGACRVVGVARPGRRASRWHFPEKFGFRLESSVPLPFRPLKNCDRERHVATRSDTHGLGTPALFVWGTESGHQLKLKLKLKLARSERSERRALRLTPTRILPQAQTRKRAKPLPNGF